MGDNSPATQLSVCLARQSPVAVIFRRGPSNRVQLIRWHRDQDRFFPGQWLKGRIYDQRCDLSPCGEHLIYFAANHRPPLYSWTAISRPPFLTALCLWPKGDCWGGGGLLNGGEIVLNHSRREDCEVRGFTLPPSMKVLTCGEYSGWGEDRPISDFRLARDGWQLLDESMAHKNGDRAPLWIRYDPPQLWSKLHPHSERTSLAFCLTGIYRKQGRWRETVARVCRDEATILDLGMVSWADWDDNGDLLYAQEGSLYRSRYEAGAFAPALRLARFDDLSFTEMETPAQARTWDQPLDLAPLELPLRSSDWPAVP